MKFNALIKCSVCEEPLPSDLKNCMFFWGKDLDEHPLIIAHKLGCDPKSINGWIYSHDVMPKIWKMLIYKKMPK